MKQKALAQLLRVLSSIGLSNRAVTSAQQPVSSALEVPVAAVDAYCALAARNAKALTRAVEMGTVGNDDSESRVVLAMENDSAVTMALITAWNKCRGCVFYPLNYDNSDHSDRSDLSPPLTRFFVFARNFICIDC